MSSITIRNLNQGLKARLRMRAARHRRSIEDEAREILRAALNRRRSEPANLGTAIHARFAPLGGVEIRLPRRKSMRNPPSLNDLSASFLCLSAWRGLLSRYGQPPGQTSARLAAAGRSEFFPCRG